MTPPFETAFGMTKEEFREVARGAKPAWGEAQFNQAWEEYLIAKANYLYRTGEGTEL